MENCKYFQRQIFVTQIFSKIWHFLTENLKGWTVRPEILHKDKTDQSWKKNIAKLFVLQSSPSLWKCNLEYENICHLKYSSPNIWGVVEMTVFNSSQNFIQILPAACLNRNWFCCKSFFCSRLCSISPQINIKSETGQRAVSKCSIWNNCTGRKRLLWWKFGLNI